jgi:hypothetical protein
MYRFVIRSPGRRAQYHQLPWTPTELELLARRLRTSAAISVFARWLIPRHAAQLQDAVTDGKIILWVKLFDNDDERRAYRPLPTRPQGIQ